MTFSLSDEHTCRLSVPCSYALPVDSSVRVGTALVLEYRGVECEVRLGRKITVTGE